MCIRDSVCTDAFSKNVSLYAIGRPTTMAVLSVVLNKYIPKYGPVKKILSDQGKPVSYTHLDVYKRQSLFCVQIKPLFMTIKSV